MSPRLARVRYRPWRQPWLAFLILPALLGACRCSDPCASVHCAEGLVCVDGACVFDSDGGSGHCFSDLDCAGQVGRTHCDAVTQMCVECLFAAHCEDPVAQICDTTSRRCVPRPPCATDASCADLPATPHCEPVSGTCVACTEDAQCPGTQEGCDPVTFTCVFVPCTSDASCTGSPETPYCDLGSGLCQMCVRDTQCASDEVCRNGACQPRGECVRSDECAPGEVCNTREGPGRCVQCVSTLDCRLGGVCLGEACTGKDFCSGDVECDAPLHCELSTGLCVECLSDAHCAPGQSCGADGTCASPAVCSASAYCVAGEGCVGGACQSVACTDDDAEPNDRPYEATPIESGTLSGRTLCPNTWDWYVVSAHAGDGVALDLVYDRAHGDPTLLVWAGTGTGPVLAGQASLTALGQRVEIPSLSREGPLWIGVRGVNEALTYELNLRVDPSGLCDDDGYEPNDSSSLPTVMPEPLGGQSALDATACFADEDWFSIDLPADLRLVVEAQPRGSAPAGNLLLSAFVQSAGGGLTLVGGNGTNVAEVRPAPAARLVLLRVTQVVPGATDYHLLARIRPPRPANDACSGALPLGEGVTVSGTTGGATDDGASACGGAGASDVVYRIDLPAPRVVTVSSSGALDTVLALRRTCGDPASELLCHDQPGGSEQLTAVLPAGSYTLWVDGYGGAEGSFDLALSTSDPPAPPANEACSSAATLDAAQGGGTVIGDLSIASDDLVAGCGAAGGDAVWTLTLLADASLTLDLAGTEGVSVSLRDTCASDGSERACSALDASGAAQLFLPFLPAGTYTVVVDGGGVRGGAFTLDWALGSPIPPATNESCQSAEPLVFSGGVASAAGDTRGAADDLEASCGVAGSGGADVAYSFALLSPQSLDARLQPGFDAVLSLRGQPCTDPASEFACSDRAAPRIFEPELPAGLYTLLVDGRAGGSGPFTLEVTLAAPLPVPTNDACPNATLVDVQSGPQSIAGATWRAADDLDPQGCLAFPQPGPDVFYAVDLLAGQTLDLVATPEAGFDLSLYVLSACDPSACLAGADDLLVSGAETLSYTAPVDQRVFIGVDAWSPAAAGTFTLDLSLR